MKTIEDYKKYQEKFYKKNKKYFQDYHKMYNKLTEKEKEERRLKKPCEFCGMMISEGFKKRHQESNKCIKNRK